MKAIRKISKLLGLIVISISFSQCASTMKLEEKAPTTFAKVYTQSWVAGVKGGGSGTNIFIEVEDKNIVLDSVFFRGKTIKLTTKPANDNLYIGRFLGDANTQNEAVIVEAEAEFSDEEFPFQLQENQCVVSYTSKGKLKYYMISDIEEKQDEALPMSAPPNKN